MCSVFDFCSSIINCASSSPLGAEEFQSFKASIASKYDGPTTQLHGLIEESKEVKVLKGLFLGTKPEENAMITSWLSFGNKYCDNDNGTKEEKMKSLDGFLKGKSFLLGETTKVSLADYFVFWTIKGDVKADTVSKFPNLCRWYNSMQYQSLVYKSGVEFEKVKFVFPDPFSVVSQSHATGATAKPQAKDTKQPKQKGNDNNNSKNDKGKKDKAKEEKKQKDKKKAAPAPANDDQEVITKLDIRVGKITKCWPHEDSDKLYCEEIDVGEESVRNIASGLRAFYADASLLENRLVLVLCNLKPRKLAGFASNGMVLCASNADHTQVELVDPPKDAKIGERVTFDGVKDGPAATPQQVAKKKVFEACAPNLKTNENCAPCWIDKDSKPHLMMTSAGPCKVPTIANGTVS